MSPFAPKSAILVDRGGMFPSSDIAVMGDPTVPAESASMRGPLGPTMTLGTLPLSDEIGEESMTMHGGWSGPDVAGTPAVVAEMGLMAGFTETDVTSVCADECEAWDSGYQREIIDGVTVYHGGDLCDLEESDWEDPDDVARREYVDQYNLICWREWNRWSLSPVGIRLDPTGGMRKGLICMTGKMPVYRTTNRSRTQYLEEILCFDFSEGTWSVSFRCGCAATDDCAQGQTVLG